MGRNDDMTTSGLMRVLKDSPEQFRQDYVSPSVKGMTFKGFLMEIMEKQGTNASTLIKTANISKTYLYQFLNGERLPGRNMALRIAFAMRLSVDETQTLLTLAKGGVLYPKVRRDAALLYCLQKKMDIAETDAYLAELGEETIL